MLVIQPSGHETNQIANNGQITYTTPGVYEWTVPYGITSVSVLCIGAGGYGSNNANGGGGGGGGGLAYVNRFRVKHGDTYKIQVGYAGNTLVGGYGSSALALSQFAYEDNTAVIYATAGSPPSPWWVGGNGGTGVAANLGEYSNVSIRTGGKGGNALSSGVSSGYGAGGGGAAGYTGNGGAGGQAGGSNVFTDGNSGTGGGGGGGGGGGDTGNNGFAYGGGGGGIGLLGQSTNGSGGVRGNAGSPAAPTGGGGGSGGSSGQNGWAIFGSTRAPLNSNSGGGSYGGGGGGGGNFGPLTSFEYGVGSNGAVRILFSNDTDVRSFPSAAYDII